LTAGRVREPADTSEPLEVGEPAQEGRPATRGEPATQGKAAKPSSSGGAPSGRAAGTKPTPIGSLTISFARRDTPAPTCAAYADKLYEQFTAPSRNDPRIGSYEDGCSIFMTPSTFEDYFGSPHAYWMRQKIRRAQRDGYSFAHIDRDQYLDDIFEINTSMPVRQGRPMAESYQRRPAPFGPLPDYSCLHHRIRTYGVLKDGHLVAYSWVYMVGEMCLFSTILGHGDHLKSGMMSLLVAEAAHDLMDSSGLKYAMYNMHDSGSEGLRFFKEQMGFAPYRVSWMMGDGSDQARQSARATIVAGLVAAQRRDRYRRAVVGMGRRAARFALRAGRGVARRLRRAAVAAR
jgi:hypothetical protein